MQRKKYPGFSLIEILIVVGLILILAAVTIVAINPAKHFRDTRNSQRSADISELLNAVTQFTAEEGRTLADLGITNACEDGWGGAVVIGTGAAAISLEELVPEFIVEIPQDPSRGSETDTGYRICQSEGGRVEIRAQEETADGVGEILVVKR